MAAEIHVLYRPISFKFGIEFEHVTCDVPQTLKVNGSKVNVTA